MEMIGITQQLTRRRELRLCNEERPGEIIIAP
jgi:hypothetical protein